VTDYLSDMTSVIDTSTNTVVATIPVGANPAGVAITPDGTRAYVANSSGTVSVIDTSTNTVVATIPVTVGAQLVAITPDGTRAYVANNGTVSVIDTSTNTVVATIPVGAAPIGVAITPDGTRAYVANENSNNVSVIDTGTNTVVATIPVGVAITPAPRGSISSNFNGTPIGGRDVIWFNSVLNVQGLGASPVKVFLTNSTIQFVAGSTPYNLRVPNATITFSPSVTSATTTFDSGTNTWLTTVPSSGLAGNTFLDALAFLVPGGGLPGGIKGVTWQGSFACDTPGISVNWKWAAAVYTSFGTDYNADGIKPVDDNKASVYKNSDHAGTPENFKSFVIGGATGGGGSNFTGGYSGTQTILF